MANPHNVEVHIQGGFRDDLVQIFVNDEIVSSFIAKTRYQIGYARIETIELRDGDMIAIHVNETTNTAELKYSEEYSIILVNYIGEKIELRQTSEQQRYM